MVDEIRLTHLKEAVGPSGKLHSFNPKFYQEFNGGDLECYKKRIECYRKRIRGPNVKMTAIS